MATHPDILTADDVFDMPVPEGLLGYELVDGRPLPVTPASFVHAQLVVRLAHLLQSHVLEHGLAGAVLTDAGFVLGLRSDRERLRSPDVAYLTSQKVAALVERDRLLRCSPDLAVEVDLTSGKKPGGQQRILDYLEAGVPLVWAIDPYTRTAIAYHGDGSARLVRSDEALDGEDVVPGFRLELIGLFG